MATGTRPVATFTKDNTLRLPKALSPSSLARWEDRREEFYTIYCSDVRTEKAPQINYMAVGSAFDAFVKSQIHSDIFGEAATKGGDFDRAVLFEKQVEPHVRDEVWEKAEFLFGQYVKTGAYNSLITDIALSPYAPEMEFKVAIEVNGVPIMGYPDLRYITKELVHVIGDFKVNGAFSNYGVSPVQGFKIARSIKKDQVKEEVHKKYMPKQFKDVEISDNCLGEFSRDWATQLTMYAWCLGEEPGNEDYVVRMEQLACRPNKNGEINVKIATHMSQISSRFQLEVMRRLVECWECLKKGHIFTDLSYEDNLEHCELIDGKLKMPIGLFGHVADKYVSEKGPRIKL